MPLLGDVVEFLRRLAGRSLSAVSLLVIDSDIAGRSLLVEERRLFRRRLAGRSLSSAAMLELGTLSDYRDLDRSAVID